MLKRQKLLGKTLYELSKKNIVAKPPKKTLFPLLLLNPLLLMTLEGGRIPLHLPN